MVFTKHRVPRFQKRIGELLSLLFSGFFASQVAGETDLYLATALSEALEPVALAYLGLAALSLASARLAAAVPLQPAILLLGVPVQALATSPGPGGAGFALGAALLLYRQGFFRKDGRKRAIALAALVAAAELAPALAAPRLFPALVSAGACTAVVAAFISALSRGQLLAAFAPRHETVDLASLGLSFRQRQFILERLGGKTIKGISIDNELAESTVRNTLCGAYRKLGLACGDELIAWGAKRDVE